MRVVVVGGTGNISTSIVRRLLEFGHEVSVFNRGERGGAPADVRVLLGDRRDRAAFEAAMRKGRFEAAIDMICFTAEDAQSGLRAFRDVGQLVHCSTVCTYGVDYDWLPVSEDHPLRPTTDYGRNKAAADGIYLAAHHRDGFPVTIIKPSTTYGPQMGLLRQVAWDFSWIDRVRKGKPILVCGDGNALHQFLHVDDAALAFAGVLCKKHCLGQTYNMVRRGFTTWAEFHRTAMRVIGREVELVGVPYEDLARFDIPSFDICTTIFRYHVVYSAERLFRDVPEFQPQVSLEQGMRQVLEAMDAAGKVPDSSTASWEDRIIAAQIGVREAARSIS